MAETIKITAKSRAKTGTAECRRLRREGRVPANIYGHRQDPVAISLNEDDIRTLLTGGAKVLDLDVDGHRRQGAGQGSAVGHLQYPRTAP